MRRPVNNEKVTEAALTRSIAVSVVVIMLCMVCLAGTTWAWYSSSVTSGANETIGANFDFSVEIKDASEDGAKTIVQPTSSSKGAYCCEFKGGEHSVRLTKTGMVTKGFCKVVATKDIQNEDGDETATATETSYYSVDFSSDKSVNFSVTGSGKIEITPMLGTPIPALATSQKKSAAEVYTRISGVVIELTPDPVPEEEVKQEEEQDKINQEGETAQTETPSEDEKSQEGVTQSNSETTEQETTSEQQTPSESGTATGSETQAKSGIVTESDASSESGTTTGTETPAVPDTSTESAPSQEVIVSTNPEKTETVTPVESKTTPEAETPVEPVVTAEQNQEDPDS